MLAVLVVLPALLVLLAGIFDEALVLEALLEPSALEPLPEQAVSIVAKARVNAATNFIDFFILLLLSVNKYSSFTFCDEGIIA